MKSENPQNSFFYPELFLSEESEAILIKATYILEKILKINQKYSYNEAAIEAKSSNAIDSANGFAVFDSDLSLKFSISEYVIRLNLYLNIEDGILILTMMNLDKFMLANKDFKLNKNNCHKLFLACLIETLKVYSDFVTPDNVLCLLGLVDVSEMIAIEKEFLQRVDYNLFIYEKDFFSYKEKLGSYLNLNANEDLIYFKNCAQKKIKFFLQKCASCKDFQKHMDSNFPGITGSLCSATYSESNINKKSFYNFEKLINTKQANVKNYYYVNDLNNFIFNTDEFICDNAQTQQRCLNNIASYSFIESIY